MVAKLCTISVRVPCSVLRFVAQKIRVDWPHSPKIWLSICGRPKTCRRKLRNKQHRELGFSRRNRVFSRVHVHILQKPSKVRGAYQHWDRPRPSRNFFSKIQHRVLGLSRENRVFFSRTRVHFTKTYKRTWCISALDQSKDIEKFFLKNTAPSDVLFSRKTVDFTGVHVYIFQKSPKECGAFQQRDLTMVSEKFFLKKTASRDGLFSRKTVDFTGVHVYVYAKCAKTGAEKLPM